MKHIIVYISLLIALIIPSSSSAAFTEDELMSLYMEVLESAVDVFEPLWVDDSERVPNSGFYDFRKYQNWRDEPYATIIVIPGNGMVQFCYSILLTESDKSHFGKERVPREELLRHVIQSMRWCCLTSTYVDNPYPYLPNTRPEFLEGQHWRRKYSYRADEVGWLTLAAAVMWPKLDDETKALLENVLVGGAPEERIVQRWSTPQGGNHDQVKQDLSSTMGAAFLFPQREDANLYMDIIAGNGIDMVSTLHDFANPTLVENQPISEWAEGWNLYQDYTSDHHGWCNIWYGGDMLFEGRCYIELLADITGQKVPETFRYPGNGFDGVFEWLKRLSLPVGEPLSPHGNEYDAFYGAGLLAYCYGAVLTQDPVASALEERAARLLQQHSQAIAQYDYHRNSWAKAGMAYLMHKYNGPRAEPISHQRAMDAIEGTYHYRWLQNLIHRSPSHIASFSWGSISSRRTHSNYSGTGLCGFIHPTGDNDSTTEPLVYCHPKSLTGEYEWFDQDGQRLKAIKPESHFTYEMDDSGFSTSGVASTPYGDRHYAFFSYEEGVTIFISQLIANQSLNVSWTGLPLYFYVRDGMTGKRTYYDQMGKLKLGSEEQRESNWWCVDNDAGMLIIDETQPIELKRTVGYNWARQPEYKDQCDGVYISPISKRPVEANEIVHDLAVTLFSHTPQEQMKVLGDGGQARSIIKKKGWKGVVVAHPKHHAIRHVAVARFGGDDDQVVSHLSFDEGAPIALSTTLIEGKQGRILWQFKPFESFRDIFKLYVRGPDDRTIQARKIRRDTYRLSVLDNKSAQLSFYVADPECDKVTISDVHDNQLKSFTTMPKFEYTVDKPIIVHLHTKLDHIPPVVEIGDVQKREDGLITIPVLARDSSGIDEVEIFCDNQSVGVKQQRPFIWQLRQGEGAHTVYAVAQDASSSKNQGVSFKRTFFVE